MAVGPQRIAVCGLALLAIAALACQRMLSPPAQPSTPASHALPAPSALAPEADVEAEEPKLPLELPEPMPRDEAFRRGVVLGPIVAPESERAFKRAYTERLAHAAALGATDVALTVSWLQTDLNAVELAPFDAIDDDLLAWLIDQAKRRKLRVQISPVLTVEGQDRRSASAIAPSSWERWWWSYSRFVQHYARVAAMRKVPRLSLGSLLTSTETQTDQWRKLIQDVRKFYKGELMYVASAESFAQVAFWEDVDVIGIATDQGEASSEAQLLGYFGPLPARIEQAPALRAHGYVLHDLGCTVHATDAERAQLCRRALFQSFRDVPLLHGVFVDDGASAPRESAQSAADVVQHWYQGSRG